MAGAQTRWTAGVRFCGPPVQDASSQRERRPEGGRSGRYSDGVRLLGRYCNRSTEVKRLRDLYTRAASEHVDRTSVEKPALRFTFSKLTSEQHAEILARYQAGDRPVGVLRV